MSAAGRGLQAHNRWLVDICADVPGRRAGIAELMVNEPADAVAEVLVDVVHRSGRLVMADGRLAGDDGAVAALVRMSGELDGDRGRVQFWVNLLGVPFADFLPVARRADELGFTGVAVSDHLVVPDRIESHYPGGDRPWGQHTDWPDAWVAIGAMAAVTTRLRFVTNVSIVALRHPLVTAKAVATVACLAPGRVVLGVGVGWMQEEFAALGRRFDDRGARTDEALAILRTAWRDGVVEHAGPHEAFDAVHVRPVPHVPVPVWIGGESEAARRRVVERGDGWISGRPLGQALELAADLRGRRQRARPDDPFEIAVSSPSDLATDDLARAADAGVDHLKVAPWDRVAGAVDATARLAALDRFADQHLGRQPPATRPRQADPPTG